MSDSPTDLTLAGSGAVALPLDDAGLLRAMLQATRDPSIDPVKLSALLDVIDRLLVRQNVAAFNAARQRMEPQLPRIKKNGEVWYPVNKNNPDGPKKLAFKFAKWEDVDTAIRPLLREHGFTLSYDTAPRSDGGGVVVRGKLRHVQGHEEVASFAVPLDTSGGKSNLQGYGSSTSFGQRYCAKLLLNLVFEGEDDDGQLGGLTTLSDAQVTELRELLTQTQTDERRYLQSMGFPNSLEEIDARDFARAQNALRAKRGRMKQAEGPAHGDP